MEIAGNLYVVAAPSGAGKTSLVNALVESSDDLSVAISHTTRPRRPYEIDHINYHFVSEETFSHMLDRHEFIEHAEVFNYHYGTSWAAIQTILATGKHIILEIDWQGAAQIRQVITDCVSIFILPPSLQALKTRLETRGQDDPDVIAQRMNMAIAELSHFADFDYLVVNDDFGTALSHLKAIIRGKGDPFSREAQERGNRRLLDDLLQSAPEIE
jgi:guanylate kinase